jgi:ribonuclease-3
MGSLTGRAPAGEAECGPAGSGVVHPDAVPAGADGHVDGDESVDRGQSLDGKAGGVMTAPDHDMSGNVLSIPGSDALIGDAVAADALAGDAHPGDAPTGDTLAGEAHAGDASIGDAHAVEALAGDAPTDDAPTDDALTDDSLPADARASVAPTGNALTDDVLTDDSLPADVRASVAPTGNALTGGAHAGHAHPGDAPIGDAHAAEALAADAPTGDALTGHSLQADAQASVAPAGNALRGEAPAGNRRSGTTPAGTTPAGMTPADAAPADAAPARAATGPETSHHDALAGETPPGKPSRGAHPSAAPLPAGEPSGTAAAETAAPAIARVAQDMLGHVFARPDLLEEALTHRSAAQARSRARPRGRRGAPGSGSNERLEFIGDRVLGLVVAEWLAERFPEEQEGELGPRYAHLVSRTALSGIAAEIGLSELLAVAANEDRTGVRRLATVLADALEALIGALYLDGGLEAARRFVRRTWLALMDAQLCPPKDPKTSLQAWALGRGLQLPCYATERQSGPSHNPQFTVAVTVGGVTGRGTAGSKRVAERLAAADVLAHLAGPR